MGDCAGKSLAGEEAGVKRYRPQAADEPWTTTWQGFHIPFTMVCDHREKSTLCF